MEMEEVAESVRDASMCLIAALQKADLQQAALQPAPQPALQPDPESAGQVSDGPDEHTATQLAPAGGSRVFASAGDKCPEVAEVNIAGARLLITKRSCSEVNIDDAPEQMRKRLCLTMSAVQFPPAMQAISDLSAHQLASEEKKLNTRLELKAKEFELRKKQEKWEIEKKAKEFEQRKKQEEWDIERMQRKRQGLWGNV